MDNKLSELTYFMLERFSMNPVSSKIVGEEWRKTFPDEYAVAKVIRDLLAELEATRKQSQELAKQCGRLGARAAIAERKLAKPIQIVNYDEFFICHVSGASDDYCKGWVDGRNAAARDVGKAGFTVEDKQ
ncbi:hypothetical protein ACTVMR_24015 [Serratia nevei]|uniref:hypothetical protein n=1 Tax=Serratia nevei TaxID=2703794 RepID=UPI003FA7EE6B